MSFICTYFSLTIGYAQLQSKYGEYVAFRSPNVWSGNVIISYGWYIVHFEDPEAIFFTHSNTSLTPMSSSIIQSDLKEDPQFNIWAKGNAPEKQYFIMKYNPSKSNSTEVCYSYYYRPIPGIPGTGGYRYYYFSKDLKTLRVVSAGWKDQIYERATLNDLEPQSGSSAVNRMKRNAPKDDGKIYE